MKFKVLKSTGAIGLAVLLASCGGGGGNSTQDPSLQLSGTTAIGMALSNATVEVKCAAGTGTATATGAGTYSITIAQGKLPCVLQVTGAGAASGVVLRSVVQAGSTDAGTGVTTAKVNVTPLTELVVAQLAGTLPRDFFASFDGTAAAGVTPEKVAAATSAITGALKAAGVDLGGIDPLTSDLVAATGTTAGNAYDQALDALAAKVSTDALPLLVTQVATAASAGSSTQLAAAMTAVQGGGLPGCPYVLSGNFRAIDYLGRMTLRPIDFSARTFGAGDGVNQMALVQDGTNPCAFTATLTQSGQTGEWQVAFGPDGVGIYRARIAAPTASVGVTGLIFPVQAHTSADVVGAWDTLTSGYFPGEGIQHYRGKATFAADQTVSSCDYDPAAAWTCVANAGQTVAERSDGGFDVQEGGSTSVATLYAYRGPSGATNVFGTTNPTGSGSSTVEQTSIVLTKLAPWKLPDVGSVGKYSETLILYTSPTGTRSTNGVTSDQITNIAVDATANTVQRQRLSDGRIDTQHLNEPVSGLRTREPNGASSMAYQSIVTGTGVVLTTNAAGATGRFLAYSVTRP